MDCEAALVAVREAPRLLEGMRLADDLAAAAASDPGAVPLLAAAVEDDSDQLTAIAAVHALAAVRDRLGLGVLTALVDHGAPYLAEHAAWALAEATPTEDALPGLVRMTAAGGFAGMLAQRTLEAWACGAAGSVRQAVKAALPATSEAGARARLVETLGLVAGRESTDLLVAVAGDDDEPPEARAAAVAALGAGPAATPSASDVLEALADGVGPLAPIARTALHDLGTPARTTRAPEGLAVAQLFLHADIDGQLRHSGQGDTGGIATLLVHLGDALLGPDSPLERVITISRGVADPDHFPVDAPVDAPENIPVDIPVDVPVDVPVDASADHAGEHPAELPDAAQAATPDVDARPGHTWGARPRPPSLLTQPGHHYASVPYWGRSLRASAAWPLRVAVRRGIRRILEAAAPVDVVHLRMADVASMAAAEVCADLGVPTVLTMAPDPQALIAARDAEGTLTRADFGAADVVEHLWFRDRLLREIARPAEHLVLFPRPDLERDMRELCALDVEAEAERVSVISEGIDVRAVARAERQVRDSDEEGSDEHVPDEGGVDVAAALDELDDLLATLPRERRGLPLAVSVGRLHPVKGMATLVRAWAEDPVLHGRCNLLVVGGDLEDPNDDEEAELERIEQVVARDEAVATGLLLAGHRPNATTDVWLAAVRYGRADLAGAPGVYVSASLKEEFGMAILEALATGLVVVAPASGGPATYVAHGENGILVDTSSPQELAHAVLKALDLAAAPGSQERAERAQRMVHDRFGIETMAGALTDVYERVAARRHPPGSQAGVRAARRPDSQQGCRPGVGSEDRPSSPETSSEDAT